MVEQIYRFVVRPYIIWCFDVGGCSCCGRRWPACSPARSRVALGCCCTNAGSYGKRPCVCRLQPWQCRPPLYDVGRRFGVLRDIKKSCSHFWTKLCKAEEEAPPVLSLLLFPLADFLAISSNLDLPQHSPCLELQNVAMKRATVDCERCARDLESQLVGASIAGYAWTIRGLKAT